MKIGNAAYSRPVLACVAVASAFVAGCHGATEWEPLTEQKIYVADKFYDVSPRSEKEAIVLGYAGKILRTQDSGFTWELIDSGTDHALFSIDFADDNPQVGWITGQEGLALKTTDGGASWKPQQTGAWMGEDCRDDGYRGRNEEKCHQAYLFAVSVVDETTVMAIGDRSTMVISTDGGQSWEATTVKSASQIENADEEFAIVFEDPVLYDLKFFDAKTGFIVGEFGKIFKTTDGGKSWAEKQGSLMGGDIFDILDLPTFFDIDFDGDTGVVAGLDGRIAVSSDGGETWKFSPNNVDQYIDPMYSAEIQPNGIRWVVGSSGQVVTAGPTGAFARGSLGSAISSWLRRIVFLDDKHGWVVGGFGLIMNTDDGGKTWYRRFG